jgi:peptide deformylase
MTKPFKLKVLKPVDPILREISLEVTSKELKDKTFQQAVELLLDYVYGHNRKQSLRSDKSDLKKERNKVRTVGLSANQVGMLKRISIVDMAIRHKGFNDIYCLINPEIIWRSKSIIEKQEGCVNLPGVFGIVSRSKTVKVKALDRSGNELVIKATGWPAILLQHEIDHLNGKLFIDHLENPKKAHKVLDKDIKEYRKKHKSWDKFIDVSNLVRMWD